MRDLEISPKMLSKELVELEANGLITRTVLITKPISVEYAITEHGKTLNGVTRSIKDWGKKTPSKSDIAIKLIYEICRPVQLVLN